MKQFYGVLATVLIAGLSLFACASKPEAQSQSPATQEQSSPALSESPDVLSESSDALAAWAGTWNNFSAYFEDPGIASAYEILAEREENSPEDVKARYVSGTTYKCDIPAMGIKGNKVTFYYELQSSPDASSNIAYSARYVDKGEVSITSGERVTTWKHFETSDSVPNKHLLLLPAEADVPGKTMIHFHFRYGSDLDRLIATDGWYPTMIAYDSTMDLLVGHMTAD